MVMLTDFMSDFDNFAIKTRNYSHLTNNQFVLRAW